MKQYNFSYYLIFGNIVYFIILLIGPYHYKVYTSNAIIYYFGCIVLFYLGLKIKFKRKKINIKKYNITPIGEKVLFICCILVCIGGIYTYYYTIISNANIQNYQFASGDYRIMASTNRTMLSRLMEFSMHLAAPIYIIYNHADNQKKWLKYFSSTIFWVTPVYYLSLGARWSLFFYVLLFYLNYRSNQKKELNLGKINTRSLIQKILIFVIIVYVVSLVMNLFDVRGINDASELYMAIPGDTGLKGWAKQLFETSSTFFNPIFKLFYYINHSLFLFSYMFKNLRNMNYLYGLYSFSIFQYLLMPFGVTTDYMKEVLASVPGYGGYMTFLHGYIVDWGFWVAPLMVFFTGIVFANIENRKNNNILCNWFYPFIGPMILISPIYDLWTVAAVNFDLFYIIIIFCLFKYLILREEEDENTIIYKTRI